MHLGIGMKQMRSVKIDPLPILLLNCGNKIEIKMTENGEQNKITENKKQTNSNGNDYGQDTERQSGNIDMENQTWLHILT